MMVSRQNHTARYNTTFRPLGLNLSEPVVVERPHPTATVLFMYESIKVVGNRTVMLPISLKIMYLYVLVAVICYCNYGWYIYNGFRDKTVTKACTHQYASMQL